MGWQHLTFVTDFFVLFNSLGVDDVDSHSQPSDTKHPAKHIFLVWNHQNDMRRWQVFFSNRNEKGRYKQTGGNACEDFARLDVLTCDKSQKYDCSKVKSAVCWSALHIANTQDRNRLRNGPSTQGTRQRRFVTYETCTSHQSRQFWQAASRSKAVGLSFSQDSLKHADTTLTVRQFMQSKSIWWKNAADSLLQSDSILCKLQQCCSSVFLVVRWALGHAELSFKPIKRRCWFHQKNIKYSFMKTSTRDFLWETQISHKISWYFQVPRVNDLLLAPGKISAQQPAIGSSGFLMKHLPKGERQFCRQNCRAMVPWCHAMPHMPVFMSFRPKKHGILWDFMGFLKWTRWTCFVQPHLLHLIQQRLDPRGSLRGFHLRQLLELLALPCLAKLP